MHPKQCPNLTTPEAIDRLAGMHAFLRDAFVALEDDLHRKRADPASFSLIEHICHLRDLEREGYRVRIERILLEDRPVLPDFDGARIARERNYVTGNLSEALESFHAARAHNLEIVSRLTPEQLGRTGMLDVEGELTLAELLTRMCAHDQEHRAQINELRHVLLSGNDAPLN